MYVVGVAVSAKSAFTGWPNWGTGIFAFALFAIVVFYVGQTWLTAKSEQEHYKPI